jgi:hypothetical protein
MASGNGKAAGFKRQIRGDIAELRSHVSTMAGAMRDLNKIAIEMDRKLAGLDATLEAWIDFANERHQDHERRLAALEKN